MGEGITKNQEIPWVRIGAESVAIIGSILLAFAIDAWWDLRGDRALESEYLASLRVEVQNGLVETQRDLQSRERLQLALGSFLSKTEEPIDRESFLDMLRRATFFNNVAPPTSVIDDLVSSGRLQLIRSAEVREGIMLFRQMMQKNDLNDEAHRTFVNTRFIPFLSGAIPLKGLVRTAAGTEYGGIELSNEELVTLVEDERFQNILIERLQQLERGLPRLRATAEHLEVLSQLLGQAPE